MASPTPPPAARVRIYSLGLGDCTLVSLPRAAGATDCDGGECFHMLMDCGVLPGVTDAAQIEAERLMGRVVRDIDEATRRRLDVVAVSHAHWDHVSGFLQARSVFDRMTICEVWLDWTQDPSNAEAGRLRERRSEALRRLRVATRRLSVDRATGGLAEGRGAARGAAGGATDRRAKERLGAAKRLRGVLRLFDAESGPTAWEAVESLVGHRSNPRVRYLAGGGPTLPLPGTAAGARAYVPGPPPADGLHPNRPGGRGAGGHSGGAALGLEGVGSAAGFFAAAAAGSRPGDDDLADQMHAFEPRYRLPLEQARQRAFFRDHYFGAAQLWRGVDGDWLAAAEQLTVDLNRRTNDSSLSLAVELGPGGRVILFPGDVQADGWRLWDTHRWRPDPPPARPVTAEDLLRRTALFKVGQRGSHTATPRGQGLERIGGPELVAVIQVDPRAAGSLGWDLPFPSLLGELHRKTRGRVLGPGSAANAALPESPEDVPPAEWSAFRDHVWRDSGGLYVEYRL